MSDCEHVEIELSAIADGCGDPGSWPLVLDHVVSCESCRTFYRDVRALDTLASADRAPAAFRPPDEVWARIEDELARPVVLSFWRRPPVRWALRAAALVVAAIGLWSVGVLRVPPALLVHNGMEVTVGENSGRMSDREFVQLAVTVLQADRQHREKMLEILAIVEGDTPPDEGALRTAIYGANEDKTHAQRDSGRNQIRYY